MPAVDHVRESVAVEVRVRARDKAAVLSFALAGVHPHDVGTLLNQDGIAVRAGHHCAQPLMRALHQSATVRASFYVYNTTSDVDALVASLQKAQARFLAHA